MKNDKGPLCQRILESIDIPIISNDLLGNVIYWNKAAEKIFGYTFEEIKEKTIFVIYPPDIIEEESKFISEVKQNHLIINYKTKLIKKDGKVFDTYINVNPLKDETGKIIGLLKVIQNVPDYKEVENNLAESELKYKNLFENAPLPMWVIDIPSLKFLAVNQISCTNYGYIKEEFLNKTVFDICPETQRSDMINIDRSKLDYQLPTKNWIHLKKGGEVVYVEVTSLEILYEGKRARLVISIDITEKRNSKFALKQSHLRLKRLTEKVPIALLQVDYFSETKNQITFISKGISEIYKGLDTESIKTNPDLLMNWIIEEDRAWVHEEFQICIDNQTDINLECRIKNLEGKISWIKMFYRCETKIKRPKTTWYGYILDITKQKGLLLNLEKQNKQLKDIAWAQSHTIRAPLTTLIALVNSLKKRNLSIVEQDQFLEYIQNSALELDNVIKDIAKLSTIKI
ncbi:MAG: PAS domain S-box protein [Bacteroidota bacterium]